LHRLASRFVAGNIDAVLSVATLRHYPSLCDCEVEFNFSFFFFSQKGTRLRERRETLEIDISYFFEENFVSS
jgi:hypothetical protein